MGTDGITRLCGSTAYYMAHSKLYTNAEMTVFTDIILLYIYRYSVRCDIQSLMISQCMGV